MTELRTLIAVIFMVILLHAYKAVHVSAISGQFPLKNAVEMVYAIQGRDTIRMIPQSSTFKMQAKPGLYTVIVETRHPYRNIVLPTIKVAEGETTDMGRIDIMRN